MHVHAESCVGIQMQRYTDAHNAPNHVWCLHMCDVRASLNYMCKSLLHVDITHADTRHDWVRCAHLYTFVDMCDVHM